MRGRLLREAGADPRGCPRRRTSPCPFLTCGRSPMFRRLRHSARVRLIEAVRDGTGHELGPVRAGLGDLGAELAELRSEVRGLRERVDAAEGGLRDHMIAWERRSRRDILTAVDQEAMRSSAAFVRAELGAAPPYFNKFDTLRAAMSRAPREGLYLEFGVASGGTLRVIAEWLLQEPCSGSTPSRGSRSSGARVSTRAPSRWSSAGRSRRRARPRMVRRDPAGLPRGASQTGRVPPPGC